MNEPEKNNDYAVVNISSYLRNNATLFPDKPALLYPVRLTYKELENEVDRYSYGLEKAGIRSGTKTLMLVPAGPEMLFIAFALFRIAAIPVLIDPGMGIKAMLRAIERVNAEAFIGISKAHLLRKIRPSVFRNVKICLSTNRCWLPDVMRIYKFLDSGNSYYPLLKEDPCRMAAIFFTSGSTGPAKGVVYTAGMLNHQVNITKDQFNIRSDETDLCTFPLLGLFAICHGNSSVMADMDMVHPAKIKPGRVIRNIEDFRCTQMFGSPMILTRLSQYCTNNEIKLHTLRNVISAGAPVYAKILKDFSRLLGKEARIFTPYGATEALPVTNISSSELMELSEMDVAENGICIGYPIEGLDVRIIEISDDQISSMTDNILMSAGQVGEIAMKGPWVSTEYYNNSEANRLSKISDKDTDSIWHRMGDLGRFDEAGRLWFYGRKSQRVISEAGTLFTIPCEAVFNSHPAVLRSALVGVLSGKALIKRPIICIQLKPEYHPSGEIREELLKIGKSHILTEEISDLIFFRRFPVDPRHNAKIFREKLAVKAAVSIK